MQTVDYQDIHDFITRQEAMYRKPVPINDMWDWNMSDHIKTSVLYANSQFKSGNSAGERDFKPMKNITRPILNLQHRTEDIEVTDVQLYVDDPDRYHLSFLVKKYHDDVFVQENDMDTFFDELNVSRIDFGGGLSKKLNKPAPEVVPLQSIAFCDQTDMLSGPIGIKHYYSPDQLLDMEKVGWGKESNGATISLPELIKLSRDEKKDDRHGQIAQTPGRYIEIYEVHGNLPKKFADPSDDSGAYETRLFICAFYQRKNSPAPTGVILYSKPETESPFKLVKRDPIYGRTLGMGGAEELFEAQVWTNYDAKRKLDMLDAASKTILKATGPNSSTIANRNNVSDMDNLQIIDVGEGSDLSQVDTFPRNIQLFDKDALDWQMHAKEIGAAQDPLQGKEPTAGTPFASLEAQIQQGMGLHDYRRKQYAKHLEEIYRDWIIPEIVKKICEGARFLSELSLEDMQYVSDRLATHAWNRHATEKILNGELIEEGEKDTFMDEFTTNLRKKGSKHFIEVLKGEFKGVRLGVKVSIAGKSKNLAVAADKITNIFRFAFSNPQGFAQVMQIPGMAKSFNQLLEFSGLSPADFSGIEKMAISQPPEQQQPQQPQMQQLPVAA
jgi:hypothetical protein